MLIRRWKIELSTKLRRSCWWFTLCKVPPLECRLANHIVNNNINILFIFLGFNIIPDIDNIVKTNYDPTLELVTKLLTQRMALPLNCRFNIFENKYSLSFYICFRTYLYTTKTLFQKLKKAFTIFIWNSKHPRLSVWLLYISYNRGVCSGTTGLIYKQLFLQTLRYKLLIPVCHWIFIYIHQN